MHQQMIEQQVQQFSDWKKKLAKELKSFRLWLRRNQLFNPDYDIRIHHILETLNKDYLTIAFAGEFSRGKTELINALFFSDLGQRILPSQAGRTTMCPTELFFDQETKQSYLRLLPIETRLHDTSIEEYKEMIAHWVEIPLIADSAAEMAASMKQITKTKAVTKQEALALGFSEHQLDESLDHPGKYEIPAWRHAVVSFPHPLLKKGLCILDTPGLNALGSEPELTMSMLPNAQAIIFMLAADAGVTASDMELWKENVQPLMERPNLGVYAVLNKIDSLWDDINSPHDIEQAIAKVVKQTSRQLHISEKQILPISAQKGLLARVKGDANLLQQSRLLELEQVISKDILQNKERRLWEAMVSDVARIGEDSCNLLEARKQQLNNQKDELLSLKESNSKSVKNLLTLKREAQTQLRKKQMALKPSQRLVEKQVEILLEMLSKEKFNQQIGMTRESLISSLTTVGILKTMRLFFKTANAMMDDFAREAELSNKMMASIYDKFNQQHGIQLPEPRKIPTQRYQQLLADIIEDADQFNKNLLTTFSEHRIVVKRFFNTTVANVAQFLAWVRKEMRQWRVAIMHPLSQQLKMEREMLAEHIADLESIQQNSSTIGGRVKALNALIQDIELELEKAHKYTTMMTEPVFRQPQQNSSNVIPLKAAHR